MTVLLPGYFSHHINAHFVSEKMFYMMYMPMQKKKYETFTKAFKKKYGEVKWNTGMIEHGVRFGNGRIGFEHPSGDKSINQEFIAYKMLGDYKQMGEVYKKIMKDYPKAKDFYTLYLTDPRETPVDENKTRILIQL
ncbi:MAG: hypothetical protein LBD11_08675 [Candidatus Peribacteria bacterium]|jgi:hypothetical protein|nr:hypothetical protein [Candidatus Peribacteria bacterium]